MKRGLGRAVAAGLLVLAAGAAPAAPTDGLDPGTQSQLAESHVTARLSPMHARRLFVLDTAFPAAEAARTYVLDGSTGAIEGMFNQAYWPNFAVSPDGSELYAVDSYWEKHTRGKRSDYLVVRDAQTLEVKEDVPLPQGRLPVLVRMQFWLLQKKLRRMGELSIPLSFGVSTSRGTNGTSKKLARSPRGWGCNRLRSAVRKRGTFSKNMA